MQVGEADVPLERPVEEPGPVPRCRLQDGERGRRDREAP